MASVRARRRSDGTTAWQVLYRAGDTQHSLTFDNDRGAQEAKRLIDQLGAAEAVAIIEARQGPGGESPTLAQWCTDYIEHLTGVTEGTRVRYRRYVALNLAPLGDLPVTALTPSHIARWVNAATKAELSAKTIANRHGFISGALEAAVRARLIASNPCKGTRLPKSTRREMVCLTRDELTLLLKYVRPDARDLVLTLAGTGLRWGEATALQARDIDVDHSRLTVARAWKFTGGPERLVGAPKTLRSRRTIALPQQVADVVIARARAASKPDELLFPGPNGGAWKSAAFHSAVWQPAVTFASGEDYMQRRRDWGPPREAEAVLRARQPWREPAPPGARLTKRPRIHDLRHTCASWLIQAGVALPVVQHHLGHESIKTTVDTYGHLEPAHLAAAADALTAALNA